MNGMARKPRSTAVVFPFDLFGSGGTASGAQLLGDALQEVIDDTKLETRDIRQQCFADSLRIIETDFDTIEEVSTWRETGRELFQKYSGDFLLWLSGNHLGTLPVYDSLDAQTLVLQFDAHLDCYNLHDTTTTLCHGNFLRHIDGERPRIVNVGHRDLFLPAKEIGKYFDDAIPLGASLTDSVLNAASIWIDIDVDVFDPAVCPATRQPVPCGLSGQQVLALLSQLDFGKVRGVSISEFDPALDVKEASLNLLGRLLEWLLLRKYGG
ncbi:hypothetical protein BH11PLA2_BH11PLA2_36710 [soil metagenome]